MKALARSGCGLSWHFGYGLGPMIDINFESPACLADEVGKQDCAIKMSFFQICE